MKNESGFELCRNGIDYHEIIECIVSALDAKDPYTAGHSQRVSDMALALSGFLKLDREETERIHIAAHLHDIGKIGVPDAVLNKPDRLSPDEWAAMKKHPQTGAQILSKSRHLNELKDIVLHHHERYDGNGYPYGLKGDEIPVGSRIISICDSVDAMTSDRGYRDAYSLKYCYEEIKRNLGIIYDPRIGAVALEHWADLTKYVAE
ncbi:HD-GYP domain-containing protein [Lacrimispora sp.]|uniref:HD-GYP domain-containing protein n=1 Tax=Lacrimispora sp. TaxID=2719234 RepID=UPI0032E45B7A